MKSITIVGSGTAGLCSAVYFKQMFPLFDITVVSSSNIGIIGVGEGSTEHWKDFQTFCEIPVMEMMRETRATHKYGIRFENWTNHTPDYFHSVAADGRLHKGSFIASYVYASQNDLLLTDIFSSPGLRVNKIENSDMPHMNTNQYHFDTFKLNEYFVKLCVRRGINMVDGEVEAVELNTENGFIEAIVLKDGSKVTSDFFIDASGFRRILMSQMEDQEFKSFSDYLPCDSAIAFPTKSDPSGEIRPYTRAVALKSGWMWEIPTQDRRGNGYVYSSQYCSEGQAIAEVSEVHGFNVVPAKSIKFNAGYYRKTWQKNCVAVGLASSFVEPLEATSIGSTLQQIKLLCSYLPTFSPSSSKTVSEYHRIMDSVMDNILAMVSLHYVSDRTDSEMWGNQSDIAVPDLLCHLLDIWGERAPEFHDVPSTGFELFGVNHFWHVAQGQGVLNLGNLPKQMEAHSARETVEMYMMISQGKRAQAELLDHAESFAMLQ
jgi:tryptophan halogenase